MLFWSLRPGSARIYWPQYPCSQPWKCDLDTGCFDALEEQVGDTKTVIDDAKEFIGAFNSEIKAQSGGVKAPDKSVRCHQATIKGECWAICGSGCH